MTPCPTHPSIDTTHDPCPECGWAQVREQAFPPVPDPDAETVIDGPEPDACFPHPDCGGTTR